MVRFYKHKITECGFVILCPEFNMGQIKISINSLKFGYENSNRVCVVPQDTHADDLKEIKKYNPAYRGGNTITSMINTGMKYAPCKNGWNFIITPGLWIKNGLKNKFSTFIETEKDILFPIVNKKANFVDGTLNGILMHRDAFKEIGPFLEEGPLNICKLMWCLSAIEKGFSFKAIACSVTR